MLFTNSLQKHADGRLYQQTRKARRTGKQNRKISALQEGELKLFIGARFFFTQSRQGEEDAKGLHSQVILCAFFSLAPLREKTNLLFCFLLTACRNALMDDYISKPVKLEELVSKIEKWALYRKAS